MDIDSSSNLREAIARARSRARSQAATNRLTDGVTNVTARSKAERLAKLSQKKMNRMARQGEADRHTVASLPKHLVRDNHSVLLLRLCCSLCHIAVYW